MFAVNKSTITDEEPDVKLIAISFLESYFQLNQAVCSPTAQ